MICSDKFIVNYLTNKLAEMKKIIKNSFPFSLKMIIFASCQIYKNQWFKIIENGHFL